MIAELRAERHRLIVTLDALTDEDFDHGTTLCAGWSPRDVLGHVIGLDYFLASYRTVLIGSPLSAGARINAANGAQAERVRAMSRTRLMQWARHWADHPTATSKIAVPVILGDLAMHHQDVLRGLGLKREVPDRAASAILLEGLQLSVWMNRRSLRHRIVPADGGRPVGRRGAPEVRGTREALGLWLAGRDSVAPELHFG
ncbi:maleylpyruvate isomerase family mycothiol-dependent enzyme [Actinocorallia longicatena]|uniref:Maleylpyruvate isomerase family mycothiol-dependent enzyme n=1 Tax=Actinocorallia longicatena TaxID=111803 RepID=A0ABP6Q4J6_9ACTN